MIPLRCPLILRDASLFLRICCSYARQDFGLEAAEKAGGFVVAVKSGGGAGRIRRQNQGQEAAGAFVVARKRKLVRQHSIYILGALVWTGFPVEGP